MTTMHKFASDCVGRLHDQVVYELARVARSHEAEAVHKLRVSIRRFQQALRLFPQYVDRRAAKRVRRRLRDVLRAAGQVRNRDISAVLLGRAGAPASVMERVSGERKQAANVLQAEVRKASRTAAKSRAALKLSG